jgi:4-amino-4-deoxy-L-arabinose transferase-like glycosyltransferase
VGHRKEAANPDKAATKRTLHQHALVGAWFLWASVAFVVYYRQIWRVWDLGFSAWVTENYSLQCARRLWHLIRAGLQAWDLPYLSHSLLRALTAAFGAGVLLLAAYALGLAACRLLRWEPESWHEGLLYRTAIGLGTVSYLSFGLATLGLYQPDNVRILLAMVLLSGSLWFLFVGARSLGGLQSKRRLSAVMAIPHYRVRVQIWQVVALAGLLVALIGALAPEIEYDALWYHLWLPKLWLEQGHAVDVVSEYVSLYPLTWELIFGAGMLLGNAISAKLLHFVCLPLSGLAVYQLVRRFVPQASPWLAVAILTTVPTLLWEATTAYIDLALAFYNCLVVYALLRYVERRSLQWLVLAALTLGLALATKHLALFVWALAVGGLVLRLWLEDRAPGRALAMGALLGSVSLLLPLAWYARAWYASGNPFFPELYSVFGAQPVERWSTLTDHGLANFTSRFGDPRTPLNWLLLPWNVTMHSARYGGALSPVFLILLPALILRRCNGASSWLFAFVAIYVVLWASPASSFQVRFLVPVVPLLAALAAEAVARLVWFLRSASRWRMIIASAVAALLLLNLPPFTSLHERDRISWDGWLTHVLHEVPLGVVVGRESQEAYLTRKVRSYGAWQFINAQLPKDAQILTFSGGDHFYREREGLWSDSTMAHPAVWGAAHGQEGQAFQALADLGISHVLFDKRLLDSLPPETLAIAQVSESTGWYEWIYEDDHFLLCAINWEQALP